MIQEVSRAGGSLVVSEISSTQISDITQAGQCATLNFHTYAVCADLRKSSALPQAGGHFGRNIIVTKRTTADAKTSQKTNLLRIGTGLCGNSCS